MQVSVEHKIFSLETITKFKSWFIRLLDEAYEACADADVLIESPSTFAGIRASRKSSTAADSADVAEAYKIAYIRAFTMPWTRTREFPHALLSGPTDSLEAFNTASVRAPFRLLPCVADGPSTVSSTRSSGAPAAA